MFLKPGLDPEDFDAIDLRAPVYAQSWKRMVARAKENGTDAVLDPIANRLETGFHPGRIRWTIYRIKAVLRAYKARRRNRKS